MVQPLEVVRLKHIADPMPRTSPYMWATWLTKPMAAEQQCLFSSWFKAHFTYTKMSSDFNLAKWSAEHGAMVAARAKALEAEGYTVYLEDQNSFRVRGRGGAVLSGKPDIVAARGDELRVVDCKTGGQRHSDVMQVLLYMFVLSQPNGHQAYKGQTIVGEVMYRGSSVELPLEALEAEVFKETLTRVVEVVVAPEAPEPAPSYRECKFCDISKVYCPMRNDQPPSFAETDLF